MNKLFIYLIFFLYFLLPTFLLSQPVPRARGQVGFGIGAISSIGAQEDWGINSQFFWKVFTKASAEFEFNQYYDKQNFRRMDEYSLNYQYGFYQYKRFLLYVTVGYLANNYDWDNSTCTNCWALRRGRWNHGLNGGIGLIIEASERADIYLEIRAKSLGTQYQIAALGLNYFMVENREAGSQTAALVE